MNGEYCIAASPIATRPHQDAIALNASGILDSGPTHNASSAPTPSSHPLVSVE